MGRNDMANRSSLKILIELSTDKRDIAAFALAESKRQLQEAERKLQLLSNYMDEYYRKMRVAQGNADDADRASLGNYQAFMSQLESAITSQNKELEACSAYMELCKQKLLIEQKRLKSFSIVEHNRNHAAQQTANRQEQKLADEFAMQASRRHPSEHARKGSH
jgi:flagellar FliJ protein